MVRGPGLPEMTRLGRIHVLNFFRDGGIWVKWKQYMTSESWSKPILLIPESDMGCSVAPLPEAAVLQEQIFQAELAEQIRGVSR